MPTIEARIATGRASRYLAQLCRHAEAMGPPGNRPIIHGQAAGDDELRVSTEWDGRHGVLTFDPPGRCTLDAGDTTLFVRIDADDEHTLLQVRDTITRDLQRFGRRYGLTPAWHVIDGSIE